jgi:hypothetical protein
MKKGIGCAGRGNVRQSERVKKGTGYAGRVKVWGKS